MSKVIIIVGILTVILLLVLYRMFTAVYRDGEVRKEALRYVLSVCLMYLAIMIIFAFAYLIVGLDVAGSNLINHQQAIIQPEVFAEPQKLWHTFLDLLYYSSITLFTVGYGDIEPTGYLKLISACEGFVGYLLPVAVIANGVVKFASFSRR